MKKKILSLITTITVVIGFFSIIPIQKTQAISNEQIIYNFLKQELGYNTAAACGVLANIEKESNFENDKMEKGYTWAGGAGYGICQWTNSPRTSSTGRRTNLVNWCNDNGYDYKSLNGQLQFLKHELTNDSRYKRLVHNELLSVSNDAQGAYDAGYNWCYDFERPAGYKTGVSVTRGNVAKNTYWPKYNVIAPDAPILTINRGTSLTTDTITISWSPANGAESYWLHIYKDGEDYVNKSINQDLSYSAKYPAGNYAAYVVSCNNGLEALSLVEFTVYDATPLNLGNSFNAYIVNNAPWKMLTVENNNNVGLYTENRKAEQMWQFTRRADGSYEILNSKTGLALDSGDANNTNLFTFADCDNEWQSWYIYGTPDNYFFKSKYSGKVIDVAGGATDDGTNVQMYEFNDTAAQKFSIYYFDHGSNLGVIQNLGDKFTARIVNNLSQKPIQPKEDTSVVLQSEANNIGQLWEFTRNSDGSYKIMNCKSGLVLDSGGENNTVYMHNDYGNIYQNWYIFGTDGNYCFKSQATNYVTEAWGGATDDGTIIQLYDSNGTEAQKFHMDIFDINKEVGNLNLDDSFNIADVILLKEYLTSVRQISEIQYLVADANQDGKINVFDFIMVKRMLMKN